ncbi:phosphoribosylformylglycinamidine cyclo-ligase [candidate division KSB1 bacterium]|nr:phosphoribosylformylglycinamidine cyclo-ligase [candidate division KSB1 bacterium]
MESYLSAGVDLHRAQSAKARIAAAARTTFTPGVVSDVGHFGGCFALADGPDADVLVASTDGVGTKLLLGVKLGMINGLGRDLVQHSVNDILMCGARPLFFLDYLAFGRMDPDTAATLAESLAAACRDHGLALIGGETAEMPGLYAPGDFDLAGTIVGRVRRDQMLDGRNVKAGDVLLGLAANGPHTNGYSLIRKVFADWIASGELQQYRLNDSRFLAAALMEPHRCYLPSLGKLIGHPELHALSHITGGGIVENTERVIPKSLHLHVDWSSWPRPELFELIQSHGQVPEPEMRQVFNLGIGAIAIVDVAAAPELAAMLENAGERVYTMGRIEH